MAQSFMAACRNYFGMKPGQTLREFGEEMKRLTHADKMEIRDGLQKHAGMEIDEPVQSA